LTHESEFAGISEGQSEGMGGEKASVQAVQAQLRALGLPYAAFYTGEFSDQMWLDLPFSFAHYVLLTIRCQGTYYYN
jgi:hypothetical protein